MAQVSFTWKRRRRFVPSDDERKRATERPTTGVLAKDPLTHGVLLGAFQDPTHPPATKSLVHAIPDPVPGKKNEPRLFFFTPVRSHSSPVVGRAGEGRKAPGVWLSAGQARHGDALVALPLRAQLIIKPRLSCY